MILLIVLLSLGFVYSSIRYGIGLKAYIEAVDRKEAEREAGGRERVEVISPPSMREPEKYGGFTILPSHGTTVCYQCKCGYQTTDKERADEHICELEE